MCIAHGDSMGTVRTTEHRHPGAVPASAPMPTPYLLGAESIPDPRRGLTLSPAIQDELCQPSLWRGTLHHPLPQHGVQS